MPRLSTIEAHPKRRQIEAALVHPEASLRDIAGRFQVSKSALDRHRRERLPVKVKKAVEAEVVQAGHSLVKDVQDLQQRTMTLLDKAEEQNDIRAALGAIREARENLKTIGLLMGEIEQPATTITWNVVHVSR